MKLTPEQYYRIKPLYPLSDYQREGEAIYIATQRQKEVIQRHAARQRYRGIETNWVSVLALRREGFSLEQTADILNTDIGVIESIWVRIRENAR